MARSCGRGFSFHGGHGLCPCPVVTSPLHHKPSALGVEFPSGLAWKQRLDKHIAGVRGVHKGLRLQPQGSPILSLASYSFSGELSAHHRAGSCHPLWAGVFEGERDPGMVLVSNILGRVLEAGEVMDVDAEREKITQEIKELERILDPSSSGTRMGISESSFDSDSEAARELLTVPFLLAPEPAGCVCTVGSRPPRVWPWLPRPCVGLLEWTILGGEGRPGAHLMAAWTVHAWMVTTAHTPRISSPLSLPSPPDPTPQPPLPQPALPTCSLPNVFPSMVPLALSLPATPPTVALTDGLPLRQPAVFLLWSGLLCPCLPSDWLSSRRTGPFSAKASPAKQPVPSSEPCVALSRVPGAPQHAVRVFSVWLTPPWSSAHPTVEEGRSTHCKPQPEALVTSRPQAHPPLPCPGGSGELNPTPTQCWSHTVLLIFLTDSLPSEDLDTADALISVTAA
ncbi:hypothetical protein P7K49_002070 [Saguinus oedipus]|uniref:Uncharacterized protein n=1 Tax=Saguinus oedipus TaxID=9490 RepID=A0ABQ9WI98_SAGOE|nr:hypothetical protein P7K49_002070 [Saguinus oedipus]